MKPAASLPERGVSLFAAGAYREAKRVAEQLQTGDGALLAAHCAHRLREPSDVIAVLDRARKANLLSTRDQRAIAAALELVARLALRDAAGAAAVEASIDVLGVLSKSAACDVGYFRAMASWMRGDAGRARAFLSSTKPSDVVSRARALLLEGWVEALNENYVRQARVTLDAILLLEEQAPHETGALANAVHVLATLQREVPLPGARSTVARIVRQLSWPQELRTEEVQTHRALAWAYALEGEYVLAYQGLAAAKATATSPHQKMLAHLDHAQIALWAGERVSAQIELELADRASTEIAWESVGGEEAMALIVAALTYAEVDSTKARSYFERGVAQRQSISPALGLAHGSRVDGYLAEAAAFVYSDDRATALGSAREAIKIFGKIGYLWRASRAALGAYRLQRSERWLTLAREYIDEYPGSWLFAEVEKLQGGPRKARRIVADMPARRREVLQLALEGLSTPEMARRLDVQPDTIKYHLKEIFKTLGVRKRAQLSDALGVRQRLPA
jgi:DNA-binding CsgD family transcriptional regulator